MKKTTLQTIIYKQARINHKPNKNKHLPALLLTLFTVALIVAKFIGLITITN